VCSRLRLESADSPQHSAESGSLSYGPPVRLRLLSTSPHGDAVTFDYEVMACLDADLHRADVMPSRAHGLRPTPERRSGYPIFLEQEWAYDGTTMDLSLAKFNAHEPRAYLEMTSYA